MLIRCPQCDHSRNISESKVPDTAELATCPKCKHRFRFRTLLPSLEEEKESAPVPKQPPRRAGQEPHFPAQEVYRPQSAFREAAEQADIWDAVDALHQRWQSQMDQHVTEVLTPRMPDPPLDEQKTGDATGELQERAEQEQATTRGEALFSKNGIGLSPAAEQEEYAAPAVTEGNDEATVAPPPPPSALPVAREERPQEPGTLPETAPRPAVFPYAQEGPPPEERVEHDLKLLHATAETRPTRDLGRLRDYPEAEEDAAAPVPPQAGPGSLDTGVPWENPLRYGWLKGFAATIAGIMFRAPTLYARLDGTGSLAPGFLFLLGVGYICLIATSLWSFAVSKLLPDSLPLLPGAISLPIALLLAPVAFGLILLFLVGAIRLALIVFAPDKADFGLVFKIVCYASAPFILGLAPLIGVIAGGVWFLAALVLGCRHALHVSWRLALGSSLPPACALLAGLVWLML